MMLATLVLTSSIAPPMLPVVSARKMTSGFGGIVGAVIPNGGERRRQRLAAAVDRALERDADAGVAEDVRRARDLDHAVDALRAARLRCDVRRVVRLRLRPGGGPVGRARADELRAGGDAGR